MGNLYLISTPIGNLKDITLRSIETLKNVDLIAAEDTRRSGKLLKEYDVNTKMISYFEHNEEIRIKEIIDKLKKGFDIALISDAGTPTISDPGYRLVNEVHKNGIKISSLPGPSSVINALSVSGLPTDHFYFEGFLPRKKGRLTRFKFLSTLPATIILFESPYRLIKTLMDIEKFMGQRIVSVCREMTKIHEEIFRGSLWKTINHFKNKKSIKGEIVILIAKAQYED
ncbi:MAG: 16S rRNA (cytidine(1402)-2'-O)-methyltransferase [Candidatus Marinimicrobia bacterium]|nr:16S rRNA (cytidine(1402)-2'-O)-methyltransferase [Candidatus Neomarinimicrobiota bacterium]